jgi:hypothetical protein
MTWAPIKYRDFFDVPRIFLARHRGRWVLFDCEFDQEADDYSPNYHVYLLPELPVEDLRGDWTHLAKRATRWLGRVEVGKVEFDRTLRERVNLDVVEGLLGG